MLSIKLLLCMLLLFINVLSFIPTKEFLGALILNKFLFTSVFIFVCCSLLILSFVELSELIDVSILFV